MDVQAMELYADRKAQVALLSKQVEELKKANAILRVDYEALGRIPKLQDYAELSYNNESVWVTEEKKADAIEYLLGLKDK